MNKNSQLSLGFCGMFRQKQNICRIKNWGSAPLIRIRHRFQTKLKTWVRFQIGVDFSSAIFVVFFFVFVMFFDLRKVY